MANSKTDNYANPNDLTTRHENQKHAPLSEDSYNNNPIDHTYPDQQRPTLNETPNNDHMYNNAPHEQYADDQAYTNAPVLSDASVLPHSYLTSEIRKVDARIRQQTHALASLVEGVKDDGRDNKSFQVHEMKKLLTLNVYSFQIIFKSLKPGHHRGNGRLSEVTDYTPSHFKPF